MRAAILDDGGIIINIIIVDTIDDVPGCVKCPEGLDIGQHIDTLIDVVPDYRQLKSELCSKIDNLAGTVRAKYITNSIGQDATYTEKARQCELYKQDGYPDPADPIKYSYVIAEANARLCSLDNACEGILAERDAWGVLGAKIEECRRKTKISINDAQSEVDINSAYNNGEYVLTGLLYQ